MRQLFKRERERCTLPRSLDDTNGVKDPLGSRTQEAIQCGPLPCS